jgi:hypothetical protein
VLVSWGGVLGETVKTLVGRVGALVGRIGVTNGRLLVIVVVVAVVVVAVVTVCGAITTLAEVKGACKVVLVVSRVITEKVVFDMTNLRRGSISSPPAPTVLSPPANVVVSTVGLDIICNKFVVVGNTVVIISDKFHPPNLLLRSYMRYFF